MPSIIFHNRLVRLSDAEAAMLRTLSDPVHFRRGTDSGWSTDEIELLGQLVYRRFIKVSVDGTRYRLTAKGYACLEQQAHPVLEPLLFEAFEAGRTSRLDATALPDLAEAMQEYGRLVRARYPSFSRGVRQQLVRQYALGLGQRQRHMLPLRQEPNLLHALGTQNAGSTVVDAIDLGLDLLSPGQPLDTLDRVFPDDREVSHDAESVRRMTERLRTL